MSNDYFNPSSLTRHTLARSSAVNALFTAVQAGFALLPGKDKLNQNRVTYYVAGGAADVYTVAMSPTLTAYATGLTLKLQIPASNTGACTINVDSLGAKPVVLFNQATPAAGDLTTGDIYEFLYDGTSFVLLGPARSLMTGLTSLSGNLTFSGDNTFSGSNTFSSDNTFSGNNTHSGDNTFSGSNAFDDDAFSLRDEGDATKIAQFQASGISTATTRTITLPDASGTMALIAATQTLTNKTISAADNTVQAMGLGQCYFEYGNTTVCTLKPQNGNAIQINGELHFIPSAGVTIGTGGLSASTLYYVYVYDNGGTLTLEASATAWAVSTTSGNAGTPIKTGDDTRTFVGMIYTDDPAAFVEDWVASYWNPVRKSVSVTESSQATTTSTSYAALGTALYFPYISGHPLPRATLTCPVYGSAVGVYSYLSPFLNGSTAINAAVVQGAGVMTLQVSGVFSPSQGLPYVQAWASVGSGTGYYGEASGINLKTEIEFWG